MISVLTLTYKRHHLLEEAIESFLRQPVVESEIVVINDNPDVKYIFDHPRVRIINLDERFSSISAKLEWGYKQCKYDFIYRLDDDDLLAPWALENVIIDVTEHPDHDVYRGRNMYFFINNKFNSINSNVNNGNVYKKSYLDRIKFPTTSTGEDANITFYHNGSIYESSLKPTMIYRWGMNTLHVSGMGNKSNEVILAEADRVLDDTKGTIHLKPKFIEDYYSQLPK